MNKGDAANLNSGGKEPGNGKEFIAAARKFVEETGGLENPQPEPPQGELVRENITPAEKRILLALAGMYQQYCGGRFGHDFMGAGEEACEVLGDYGLMEADDEIDDMAVARLAGHKTQPPHPNTTGDK